MTAPDRVEGRDMISYTEFKARNRAWSARDREVWQAAIRSCIAEITSIWGADLVTTQAALDDLLECRLADDHPHPMPDV
jgi:hypothetical protein